MKIFNEMLPFYKGNFHTHTTISDGDKSPGEAMILYKNAGYDFIAITDHRVITIPNQGDIPDDFIMVTGIELDYKTDSEQFHILGLGIREIDLNMCSSPQEACQIINKLGGISILAHPAWSLNSPESMMSLKDQICAIEIWNSVSRPPYNAYRADSSILLDIAFSQGLISNILANDDTHFYTDDFGYGWNMVQAKKKDAMSIIEAIKNGFYYSTQGPAFYQIEVTPYRIIIDHSPVEMVIFISNINYAKDRFKQGTSIMHSEWKILPEEKFVRVQIIDKKGKSAWSNPIFIDKLRES